MATTTIPTTTTPEVKKPAPITLTRERSDESKGDYGATESPFLPVCAWAWLVVGARASPTPCSSKTAPA